MARLIFALCAVLTVTFFGTPGRSEDTTLPTRMIDFLKPGMHVGIQSVEGTTDVKLDVYTDQQYRIARDLAALDKQQLAAAEFASDRPVVREKLDAFIEQLIKTSPSADTDKVIVFPLFRTSFGTVSAIGDDYVVIEREGARNRRLILDRASVSQIDLDAEPLRFVHTSMR